MMELPFNSEEFIDTWNDIPNYEGLYKINNSGDVISLNYKRTKKIKILKPNKNKRGYLTVALHKNKKQTTIPIHQLVAITFLNHTPNGMKLVVDHKDNNKTNNHVSNLQLISNRKNISKGYNSKKTSSKYTGVSFDKSRNKWISAIQFKGKNKTIGRYDNEHEAYLAYKNKIKEYGITLE